MLPQPPTQQNPEGQRPDVRGMLIDILTKAMRMAEQNGIDFQEILDEVMNGSGKLAVPPPVPPPAM